jgi:hypothetical protein
MRVWNAFVLCSLAFALTASAYEIDRKHNEVKLTSLKDFTQCVTDLGDDSGFCLNGLTKYIQGHKKEAFEAGKLVRLNMKHWAALPFFEIALGNGGEKFCKDEDVHLAAIAGLGLPSGSKDEDRLIGIAQTIAIEKCWAQMKEGLNKEVDGTTGYLHENACNSIKQHHITLKSCDTATAQTETKPAGTIDPAVADLGKIDVSHLEVIENGVKVFTGDEGRKITIVHVKPEGSNHVLIKFAGFKGPWNGKTVLHLEKDVGNNKADYVAFVEGSAWVSVAKRDSWGQASYTVYPKGDNGEYQVGYSDEHSAKASARDILKEFKSERRVAGK